MGRRLGLLLWSRDVARILVYDLPTRLFHGLLAFGFLSSMALAQFADEHGSLFSYHMILGLVIGLMVILRVVWGFVGTRYARFGSFLFGPGAVIGYFKGVLVGGGRRYVGHSPGSSYAIFAMLGLPLLIVASGLLMSGGGEAFEEVHSVASYVLLAVVGVHLAGIIIHTLRRRENISASMVTGTKESEPSGAIASARPITAIVFILVTALWTGGLIRNYNRSTQQTTLPFLGVAVQLGEAEHEDAGHGRHHKKHHEDDDD